ncbi:MAG: NAD(P)/FAD-dependent oxidoreductase [Thermoplasmata archaeon]|nr:MAG: NAD(P)/FAD-dependent oxidoreductase [Thermoplasmata archaeon]
MTGPFKCDVLVIGAGPAGATAALEAARAGADVMIIDRKHVIGEPIACAGYIPAWITQHIKLNKKCIENKVAFMRTFMPDGSTDDTKTPGYIVDRAAFDRDLVRQGLKHGAKLYAGMTVLKLNENGAEVRYKNDTYKIESKITIGADGPKSVTGKYLGARVTEFIIAKQYEMMLKEPMDYSEVYFSDDYTGGYAWLFPKGKYANVGVGMIKSDALKMPARLEQFVEMLVEQNKIHHNSNIRTAEGLVPIGGPLQCTVKNNVMLAGDAAGLTHPITGAGILSAVISGKEAGTVAAEALAKAKGDKVNPDDLKRYEKEWQCFLSSDLELAYNRRKLLNGYYLKEHDKFKTLADAERKCWVVFKGYYHDDK